MFYLSNPHPLPEILDALFTGAEIVGAVLFIVLAGVIIQKVLK